MSIAATILEQLGGRRFTVMTGAKQFLNGGDYLQFTIGKNSSRANRVTIKLMPSDTYQVRFSQWSTAKLEDKELKVYDDVYNDCLQDIFTSFTGLRTSL